MKPLRTVESDSFKRLVTGLCPTATVMTRTTLAQLVSFKYDEMISSLSKKLDAVDVVCTTTDLWSSQNRSFLGITVHWLETVSLERMSAALACKRFKGGHTYDKIAAAIHEVHVKFNIDHKVSRTCTDNGSNMVKAFKEFEGKIETQALQQSTDSGSDDGDGDDDIGDGEANATDLLTKAADGVNDDESEEPVIVLPRHMRCCTHTINLVATTDAQKACDDKQYKRTHNAAMAKAAALWNLTSRSTKAADTAFDILGYRFNVPTVTSWNSFYEAVSKIIRDEAKTNKVCQALNLPVLTHSDIVFLKEYAATLKPLATAIDILQGEKNCYMGYVLPTIQSLMSNIQSTPSSVVAVLKKAVTEGLHARFDHYFTDEDFILATLTHPKFKLSWVDDTLKKAQYTQLLETACSTLTNEIEPGAPDSDAVETEDEDRFLNLHTSSLSANNDNSQCLAYLSDPDRSIAMLSRYPKIKHLFIKYNTDIPSSAAVELLFSSASIVLCKRRNRLCDETFEKLLLLRQNKHIV